MVCSAGRRAVSARNTVSPPTPLSKTPMGASIRVQDACKAYFEKGMFQDAEDWFGTPKRICARKLPAVASTLHKPAFAPASWTPFVPQGVLPVCFAPDGSVSVYETGQAGVDGLKSQLSVAKPSPLPTGSAFTSTLETSPSSNRADAG